jgi:hypothetical protein
MVEAVQIVLFPSLLKVQEGAGCGNLADEIPEAHEALTTRTQAEVGQMDLRKSTLGDFGCSRRLSLKRRNLPGYSASY